MAIKKKPEDPPPSKAYLVSFGDTMTTLLAFFIVLCSLAEEQTGADLYSGTGSFIEAMKGMGLPGKFEGKRTSKAVQLNSSSPLYVAPDLDENKPDPKPSGPEESNDVRTIDRETEVYQRMLNEIDRIAKIDNLPETKGEVVFDFFNRFNREPPYLNEGYRKALLQLVPSLRRETHRVDIVVWANMPSPKAWQRAANQATEISAEAAKLLRLNDVQKRRLRSVGKPWRFSDAKRPICSVIVRKVDTPKAAKNVRW